MKKILITIVSFKDQTYDCCLKLMITDEKDFNHNVLKFGYLTPRGPSQLLKFWLV